MTLIQTVMKDLENEIVLEQKYQEHPLSGQYIGCRECHIQPDWLLIYQLDGNCITFVRTGS